jgi:small nuclear ribonucleoprotein (snRNP)-like protein
MSKLKDALLNKIIDKMFGDEEVLNPETSSLTSIFSEYIGKRVIVRTYSSGAFYAILRKIDKDTAILDDSRRIWKWVGASELTDLAENGIKNKSDSRISIPSDGRLVNNWNEILPCSEKCIKNIDSIPHWSEHNG